MSHIRSTEFSRVGPFLVLAVAITGILAFTIICAVGYVVARQLLNVARSLPEYRTNIKDKIASVHSSAVQSLESATMAIEDISGDVFKGRDTKPPDSPQPPTPIQPVRVIDPDRTQLQSATEILMRYLRPIGTFGVVIV